MVLFSICVSEIKFSFEVNCPGYKGKFSEITVLVEYSGARYDRNLEGRV